MLSNSSSTLNQSYTTPTSAPVTSAQRPAGTWRQNTNRAMQRQYGTAAAGAAGAEQDNRYRGDNEPTRVSQPVVAQDAQNRTGMRIRRPAGGAGGVTPTGMPDPNATADTGTQAAATSGALPPGSPGAGWTQGADGGWLPPGHPAAQGGSGGSGGTSSPAVEPNPVLYSPYGSYPGRDPRTVATTNPLSTYEMPDRTGQTGMLWDALDQALAAAPVNRAAQKEAVKEEGTALYRAAEDRRKQAAAARGLSGATDSVDTEDAMNADLLRNYRQVDTDADNVEQQRRLAAINALDQALTSEGARNRADATFDLTRDIAENTRLSGDAKDARDNYTLDLSAFFNREGNDVSKFLANLGLGMDEKRLRESGRQFDAAYLLDVLRLMEQARQFGGTLNLGYANTNAGLLGNYMGNL